jgi:tRNA modification GTPase
MDTIFALASARGRAGVAVLRLSGPGAHGAVVALAGALPEPRRAALRRLVWQGEILDEALVLAFAEGASFTGEAAAELQLHGGQAVVTAVLRALGEMPGLRMAEPGEFTRRALENGRLDLAQVEGLADLIDAETEAQRRQAQRVLSGAIGRRAEAWRQQLIRACALLEASIDFADEDVPVDVTPEVLGLIDGLIAALDREIAGALVAERVRDGFEVAIVGAPNVGKSTLLNALAGREAAITSAVAGTTRDVIEVRMDLGGVAVTLLDTAGLRETADEVEQIGILRARQRAEAADLRVFLLEGEADLGLVAGPEDLVLRAKDDQGTEGGVSGKTGAGLDHLIGRLTAILGARSAGTGVMTRERHRRAMISARRAMESARGEIERPQHRAELAAADLWGAIRALDMLVGRLDVEDLLDEIFSSFCIGK